MTSSNLKEDAVSEEPIIEFTETTADLYLYKDVLVLRPKGIGGFLTKGLQGEKRIPLKSIAAIQVKEAGILTGYIQFTIAGGNESTGGGAMEAIYDENSFMFGGLFDGENNEKNKKAHEVQKRIESYESPVKTAEPQNSSLVEQIEKLKELSDSGVLSDEEFMAAKAKLLS
jgi:hypothetical protein